MSRTHRTVRIQNLGEAEATYFANRFRVEWNYDIYTVFVQQAWDLLRDGGVAGFILPNKFLGTKYGIALRTFLSDRGAILKLMDFGDYQVFQDATTYTCLLFLRKGTPKRRFEFGSLTAGADPAATRSLTDDQFAPSTIPLPEDASKSWVLVPTTARSLFEKLGAVPKRLKDIAESVYVGLQTSADSVYIAQPAKIEGGIAYITDLQTGETFPVERGLLHPILLGRDIQRWSVDWRGRYLIFPYSMVEGRVTAILSAELRSKYPLAARYFEHHKSKLKARDGADALGENWHLFVYEKNLDKFEKPKILTATLADRSKFTVDSEGRFYFVGSGGGSGGYGLQLKDDSEEARFYLLGVLNSRPVEFYLHLISTKFRGGFFAYNRQYLEPLPIPDGTPESRKVIGSTAAELTQIRASLVGLVQGTDRYMEALAKADELESRLDRLTLDLFGITAEEEKLLPRLPESERT